MSVNPLNPVLYRLLLKKFGSVKISSEGCPAYYQRVPDPFRPNKTILHSSFWGEYYCVRCPFCNDQRYRLWINHLYASEVFNGRRQLTHLAICYNNHCMTVPGRAEQLEELIFGLGAHLRPHALPIKPVTAAIEPKPITPPGTIVSLRDLPSDHEARQYVISRGFDPDVLADKFDVGFCAAVSPDTTTACKGRIYIPVKHNGALVGWQCRAITDAAKPKYLNAPAMKKSTLLYNYDQARSQPFVVVVEGVPSVWRLGAAAVCLFGKSMSMAQHNLIVKTWANKPIFLLLDQDAKFEMEQAAALLSRSASRVIQIILPDTRDPADYSFSDISTMLLDRAAAEGVLASLV